MNAWKWMDGSMDQWTNGQKAKETSHDKTRGMNAINEVMASCYQSFSSRLCGDFCV
jgi:hypothetical protein